jgi:DNA-binding NtrC family response regulator
MEQRKRAPLIFCERSGQWAAAWRIAWRRRLRGAEPRADIRVRETRSAAECLEAIESAPAAFVVLELTAADCDRALDLLFEISTRYRGAAAAVAAERTTKHYEWLAREMGAVHVLVSPRELPSLVGMVERFAERFAARFPQRELEFEDRVWASLPWGDA